MRDIHSDIDFNGDCRMGIVARDKRGDLWVYLGNGNGGFADRERIGNSWDGFEQIAVVQRGKGSAVIVTRRVDAMRV